MTFHFFNISDDLKTDFLIIKIGDTRLNMSQERRKKTTNDNYRTRPVIPSQFIEEHKVRSVDKRRNTKDS